MNTKWIDVPESDKIPVDLADMGKCQISGMFYQYLECDGTTRRLLTYIPEGFRHNNRCIIAAGPENQSSEEFLNKSGLEELADRDKVLICLLEPTDGKWNFDGSDADFMNQAYKTVQNRKYFVVMQDCIYAMGFGKGAGIAHQAVQRMASEWSGLATFGEISDEILASKSNSSVEDKGTQTEELFISGKKAQEPVWILVNKEDDTVKKLLSYWKKENHAQDTYLTYNESTRVYLPEYVKDTWKVNDDNIAQTRITVGFGMDELSFELISEVWSYIGLARRHRGYDNKVLRYFRDPMKHGATYHKMEVAGMMREWYEYVPKQIKNPGKKMPLVVVFHGRGGNAETFFDTTEMSLVAEERGFIALFPTADIYQIREGGFRGVRLWNGNYMGEALDSLPFIRKMIEDVEDRLPVDKGRIYACGQSSGGYMTAYCALAASDIFCAVAPWSGFSCPGLMEGFDYKKESFFDHGHVPIQLLVGKKDNFFGQESVYPVEGDSQLTKFIKFIIDEYELDKEVQSYSCFPIDYTVWNNSEGIPMLIVGLVNDMPHANYAEESWIAYDQFLCKFSKDENGNRYYMGSKIS